MQNSTTSNEDWIQDSILQDQDQWLKAKIQTETRAKLNQLKL